MAANKFATMLYRKTNKLTLILTYVILEWILIVLLLLNSLYSYLIIKFADYFGLKRPCLWCSRLDHILEPQKYKNLHKDLVCEHHANEISKLGYCSSHQKLAESQDMCEDCSSSSQSNGYETSKKIAFFRWVKDIGMVQSDGEKRIENDGEVNLNCSCCDVSLNSKFYSPYLLIKPSWDVMDYTQKEKSMTEAGEGDNINSGDNLDRIRSDYAMDGCTDDDDDKTEEKREEGDYDEVTKNQMLSDVDGLFGLKELGSTEEDMIDMVVEAEQEKHFYEDEKIELIKDPSSDETLIQISCIEDSSLGILQQTDRSFSTEIIESTTTEDHIGKEDHGNSDFQETNMVSEVNLETGVVENVCSTGETMEAVSVHERKEEARFALIESMELEENEEYFIFHATGGELVMEVDEQVDTTRATQTSSEDGDDVHETGEDLVMEVHEEVAITQATQTVSELVDDVEEPMKDLVREVHEQVASTQTVPEVVNDVQATLEDLIMEVNEQVAITQTAFEVVDDVQATMGDLVMEVHEQVAISQTVPEVVDDVQATMEDLVMEVHEQTAIAQTVSEVVDDVQATGETAGETDSNVQAASEEVFQLQSNENEVEILMGTEMVDQEDPSTSSVNLIENDDQGAKQFEEEQVERRPLSIEINERVMNKDFTLCLELNDNEEERVPTTPTPTYIEGLHHLHKHLVLEKKELGIESLDGSVISEFESGEGVSTVEKLHSALRNERKALNALYAELEEERSASAIAANQTMAMINRLQEEKAAMQMEAFQYQRMMEEQSEYDQEALQLLNELMVKREKEKQELEKELEVYRKKVMDYEKLMMLKRLRDGSSMRSGTSSASFSNAEDSDGLSVDLNHEAKGDDSFYGLANIENDNHNTPVDEILNLDESLAHFEEERMSILEQLKVLEEKLFTLDDEQDKHFVDVKPIEHFYEENGNHFDDNNSDFTGEVNGIDNGLSMELNEKHHQERIMAPKPKRLLPLFDAVGTESEDGEFNNGHENGFDSVLSQHSLSARSESDSNKHAIEEEVDHVYERLQALEADREFLRHCIGSLKKGDKGIDLLQEILLHLRDLRNVDLRVKNIGDGLFQ